MAPRSSFKVLGGPLNGRELVLQDDVNDVLIGCDARCQLRLELPGVSPIHARVRRQAGVATVFEAGSPGPISVNDDVVRGRAPLRHGDILWLGAPGEAQSVMIQVQLAPLAAPATPAPALPAAPTPPRAWASAAQPVDEPFFIVDSPEPAPAAEEAPQTAQIDDFLVTPAAPEPTSAEFFHVDEAAGQEPAAADEFFIAEPELKSTAGPLDEPSRSPPATAPASPAPAPERAAAPGTTDVPAPAAPPAAPARPTGPMPPRAAAARPASRGPALARRTPPVRREAARSGSSVRYVWLAAALLAVLGGGGFAAWRSMSAPRLESVSPNRARAGQLVTLAGRRFAPSREGNRVVFDDRPGTVAQASATQIQAEVPDLPTTAGRDLPVKVRVEAGGRTTRAIELAVYQSPRIQGLSPDVAMPGDELTLAGSGWGPGATVQFGSQTAELLMTSSTALRVRVPTLEGAPGTSVPVSVAIGGERSNEASFVIGRLPLLEGLTPSVAAPGELVTLRGRGFHLDAQRNEVTIGGQRALVVASKASELKVMVPFAAPGAATLELRVPGVAEPAGSVLEVTPAADPVEWRFVAQPFEDAVGHVHVFLSTALGPTFVLSAAGGRTAAERAVEGALRLNEAAGALRASLDADFRARGPALELLPKQTPVLEASSEDAAAYSEGVAGRARGGSLTPERLAQWWAALARDLVLILVRGQKPSYAAGLGAEGRILADVQQAAQRTGRFGVARQVVAELKPAQRQALLMLALRVPAALLQPAPSGSAPAGVPAAGAAPLRLQGQWSGFEVAGGAQKLISVSFGRSGGTLTFTEGVSIGVPLLSAETPQRNSVRFSAQVRGGVRYYLGTWNGEKLSGRITTDPAGRNAVGTFELTPGI